jgi:hypothetical protein
VKGRTLSCRAEQSKAKAGTSDDAPTNDEDGLWRQEWSTQRQMVYGEEILGTFDDQQTLRPYAALVTEI